MEVHGKSVAAKTRKIYKINWHVVDFAPNKMEKRENNEFTYSAFGMH